MGSRPEPAATPPRDCFGIEQGRIGTEAPKDPSPAIRDQFVVDVPLTDPERAEESPVLITRIAGDPHAAAADFFGKRRPRLPAEGLTEFRTVDADEPNFLRSVALVDARHSIAIMNNIHPPQRPSLRVVHGAHRNSSDDQ